MTPTQARAARRLRRSRRRRVLRYFAFTAVGTIALLFILSLFAGSLPISIGSGNQGELTGERVRGVQGGAGNLHFARGQPLPVPYTSVPATSGYHYSDGGAPARWGVYTEPLEDGVLLHNLEHGGIGIHYDCPDGCADLAEQLTEIADRADTEGLKVLLSPYPGMDTPVALTAWTFIEKLEGFDGDRIRSFINSHESSPNAPEPNAR
jgi:hypothetical protein